MYSYSELIEIEKKIVAYEKKILTSWTDFEKCIFIYDCLRKDIVYYPDEMNDRNIRSLLVLCTRRSVCSGYALVFKEFMDRLGITCNYIQNGSHVWNQVQIDGEWYDVDLTWDACTYNETKTNFFHYFSNNKNMFQLHDTNEMEFRLIADLQLYLVLNLMNLPVDLITRKFMREDGSEYYLSQIPIGMELKVYLFHEYNQSYVLVSEDDFEIILSQGNQMVISCYVNTFFSFERIVRRAKNNCAYIGRGVFEDNCFYKRKSKETIMTNILKCEISEDKIIISINVYDRVNKIMVEFNDHKFRMGEIKDVKNTYISCAKSNDRL